MREVLSTYGSRGDFESMVGRSIPLRTLGAELLVRAGVPRRPTGVSR